MKRMMLLGDQKADMAVKVHIGSFLLTFQARSKIEGAVLGGLFLGCAFVCYLKQEGGVRQKVGGNVDPIAAECSRGAGELKA